MNVLADFVLELEFEDIGIHYVDLKTFPLLGRVAMRLAHDKQFLTSYTIEDGVPEWDGQCLIGPEDLLAYSVQTWPSGNNCNL
jgi:hypothetical protein